MCDSLLTNVWWDLLYITPADVNILSRFTCYYIMMDRLVPQRQTRQCSHCSECIISLSPVYPASLCAYIRKRIRPFLKVLTLGQHRGLDVGLNLAALGPFAACCLPVSLPEFPVCLSNSNVFYKNKGKTPRKETLKKCTLRYFTWKADISHESVNHL